MASEGSVMAQGSEEEQPKPSPSVPTHSSELPPLAARSSCCSRPTEKSAMSAADTSIRTPSKASAGKPEASAPETAAQISRPAQIIPQYAADIMAISP